MEPRLRERSPLDRGSSAADQVGATGGVASSILDVVGELVDAPDRDSAERIVCEGLAAVPHYRLAWIGEREFGGDRIRPRVVRGEHAELLEEVPIRVDDATPASQAIRTGELQVLGAGDDPDGPPGVLASERDPGPVVAVPLGHDGPTDGVLAVYGLGEAGFGQRELAGLETLGRAAGFAIRAARRRDLLVAESAVELEFDCSVADVPLVDLAGTHGCTLELEGYVPAGDGWLEYLAVEGATPSEVLATMEETVPGQVGRVLTGGTDGGRIGVSVSGGALVAVASTMGVTVADARAGPTAARAVLEVPGDADARAVATQFQREYPAAELVANRSREGTPDAGGRPEGPLGTLTDRQREVLIVAHRAGYFEWPRDSTAAELADDLDIDRSTLHGHLRKAQDRIVSTLLDGEDAVRPTR